MTKRSPESPEPSSPSELIAALARALDARHIPYLLIGGRAVIEHGYTRTTDDIDLELAIGPWEADRLRDLIDQLGLQPKFPGAFEQVDRSLLLPLVDRNRRIGVDFAFAPSTYLEEAIRRAPRHEIHGYRVAIAAVEDLVIRKVIANRPRDREDIDQLLRRHEDRVDLAYIAAWLERFEEVVDQPLRPIFNELLEASRR